MPESPLSFCMVTTFYPPHNFGGDGMHVYRLTNELARRGHRVTVIHSRDAYYALRRTDPTGDFPHEDGVTVYPLASGLGSIAPLVTYLTGRPGLNARPLDAVFAQERFDIVHFHNVSLVGGPGVLAYGDGVKLYTMNEHWLVCPTHVLWKYNRRPCEKPAWARCMLAQRRPPQPWRYTGHLERELHAVDVFLSPSRFTADKHRERGFKHPIRHLPYFVPLAEASGGGAAPPAVAGRPYFLFVGRLEKLKGVQTLVERFRSYDAADLMIAGDGGYAEELRRQAEGLRHVHFVGHVQPDALRGMYAGAIALLIPSIGYEVFGIVALEAFAQRTPVIVRDLGALPEIVEDSDGGFVYETDGQLLEAMETLRTDPAQRHRLGERGHEAWTRLWSERPHLDAYFAAIEQARASAAR